MQVAIVVYPKFTALDAVGPYEVLSRLPETEVVFVSETPGLVADKTGSLSLLTAGLDEAPNPEVLLVPGGPGQPAQMSDGTLHEWLRTVDRTSTWTTAVCTGTVILAATGLLSGRRAATHWLATDKLIEFGVTPSQTRVAVDGKYVTGAGVSAGIDMALTMAGLIAGDDVAQMIQLNLEYAPEPPYDAGTPDSAPPNVVKSLTERRDELMGNS